MKWYIYRFLKHNNQQNPQKFPPPNPTTTNTNLKKIRELAAKASQLKLSSKKLFCSFHLQFSMHFNHKSFPRAEG